MTEIKEMTIYLLALFALLFGFVFWGRGGTIKIRRSASSSGIGVRLAEELEAAGLLRLLP